MLEDFYFSAIASTREFLLNPLLYLLLFLNVIGSVFSSFSLFQPPPFFFSQIVLLTFLPKFIEMHHVHGSMFCVLSERIEFMT